jgi:hypothetical protein
MTCQPAITNEFNNPSAEVDTSSWSAHGGVTLTRDTTEHHIGAASFKHVNDGINAGTGMFSSSIVVTQGETWTASAYVKGASGTVKVQIQEHDAGEGFLTFGASTPVALTTSWQRIDLTRTLAHASVARLICSFVVDGNQAITWYVDALQLEEQPAATNYADGSLGTGYAWTSTEHNSPSTRSASADCTGSPYAHIRSQFELRPY